MRALQKGIPAYGIFTIWLAGHVCWGAETICDLRVYIRDPSGKAIDAPVKVVDERGMVRAELQSRNGIADVCDLGLFEVSVIVGADACGQTEVRRIKRLEPESIVVTYRNCHAHRVHSPCVTLLRVKSHDGKPLLGASLRIGATVWDERSDQYGRLFLPMDRIGKRYDATVSHPHYEDQTVELECSIEKTRQEMTVVMRARER